VQASLEDGCDFVDEFGPEDLVLVIDTAVDDEDGTAGETITFRVTYINEDGDTGQWVEVNVDEGDVWTAVLGVDALDVTGLALAPGEADFTPAAEQGEGALHVETEDTEMWAYDAWYDTGTVDAGIDDAWDDSDGYDVADSLWEPTITVNNEPGFEEHYGVDYVQEGGVSGTYYFHIKSDGSVWGGMPISNVLDITDITCNMIEVYEVTSVAFSPNYDIDETVLAIVRAKALDPPYSPGPPPDEYIGYFLVAGTWNSINAWNEQAEFDDYPVLIENDSNLIIDANFAYGMPPQPFFLLHTTDLALPYDYKGDDERDRVVMVSVNGVEVESLAPWILYSEGGYAFFIEDTELSCELLAHEGNPWVSSIDYYGSVDMEGKAMAGLAFPEDWTFMDITDWYMSGDPALPCCEGVQVLRSEAVDVCCPDWEWAQKPPTGQFDAQVAYTPDGEWGYASTEGCSKMQRNGSYADESAWSVSGHVGEIGDCWNQRGLIDTDIDYLADVAVNPACGYIYLVSVNLDEEEQCCECDSVWRSDDDGSTYMRVWCKDLTDEPTFNGVDTPQIGVLGLAPEEEDEVITLYMADRGTEVVYYADESGLCKWNDRNTGLDNITDIAVADEATIYALDFDGNDMGVAKSTQHARRWDSPEDSGVDEGHTIVCVGESVLVGGTDGKVGYSDDGGEGFSELDDIGAGDVHVAFDSYFSDNDYVYAAVNGEDKGVYRTTIADGDFEDMDACAYDYYGIMVSYADGNPKTTADTGGVLYASYYDTDREISGAARCLAPASELCCGSLSWDYLEASLHAGSGTTRAEYFTTEPSDLALCGCLTSDTDTMLWAIDNDPYYEYYDFSDVEFSDSAWGRLWVYEDCLSKAGPDLVGVADGATIPSDECYCYNEEFVLEWERICNACEYEIQIALDEAFRHIVMDTSDFDTNNHAYACDLDVDTYKPSKPASPSLLIEQDTLDCNQQYWWRVRSRYTETDEVIRSQWSDKWSFTVAVGPGGAIELTSPDDGATNVPLEGVVFTWTAVAEATGYDFALMDASGGSVDSKTGLTGTSYAYSGKLSYDTAYTWQVAAMKGGNVLSESSVSTFRAVSEPVPPAEFPELVVNIPPTPGTSAWVWAIIGIGAVLVIVVIVLIFRTRKV